MRKIVVFTPESEIESARNLGFQTEIGNKFNIEDLNDTICIRWGMGSSFYSRLGERGDAKYVINPMYGIKQNVNKPQALKLLSLAVNTPKQFIGNVPNGKLAVYRPTKHAAGKGFSVVKGPHLIAPDHYATEFIPTDTEYRMFFCGGVTMCALRIPNRTYKPQKYVCRSMFAYRFVPTPPGLHEMTLRASRAVGLEVGACDILKYQNKFYFLECNSGVTCDWETIIKFYRENLLKLIDRKFPKQKTVSHRFSGFRY